MEPNLMLAAALVALAAGGVAYVFVYPLLSGDARAEKRQQALVGAPSRKTDRTAAATGNRRDQVAQTLKELENREKQRSRVSLDARIAQAGLAWTARKFYAVSAGLALGLAFVVFVLSGHPIASLGALVVGGVGLPRWILNYLKAKRINRFLLELPNAMDIIVRGIRSGLPLNDCLRIIASEAQEPVRSEFRQVIESLTLGISVGEAVGKIYERVPVAEANFFGIVIGIQQKAGGNLSEALGNLSKVLRERKKMKDKVKSMSSEAKASAGIIACLPFTVAILTYLSSPSYIELLWKTSAGTVGLAVSAVWMSIGVFVMKKMINFDV